MNDLQLDKSKRIPFLFQVMRTKSANLANGKKWKKQVRFVEKKKNSQKFWDTAY